MHVAAFVLVPTNFLVKDDRFVYRVSYISLVRHTKYCRSAKSRQILVTSEDSEAGGRGVLHVLVFIDMQDV